MRRVLIAALVLSAEITVGADDHNVSVHVARLRGLLGAEPYYCTRLLVERVPGEPGTTTVRASCLERALPEPKHSECNEVGC